jgi:hypothetical protein
MVFKYFTLLVILAATTLPAFSQEKTGDQNLWYQESRQHYMLVADSLTQSQSTTLQQTYKAYDFLQLKQEKKDQRREWRQQNRAQRAAFGDIHYYRPFESYGYAPTIYHRNTSVGWMEYLTLTSIAVGLYSLLH